MTIVTRQSWLAQRIVGVGRWLNTVLWGNNPSTFFVKSTGGWSKTSSWIASTSPLKKYHLFSAIVTNWEMFFQFANCWWCQLTIISMHEFVLWLLYSSLSSDFFYRSVGWWKSNNCAAAKAGQSFYSSKEICCFTANSLNISLARNNWVFTVPIGVFRISAISVYVVPRK